MEKSPHNNNNSKKNQLNDYVRFSSVGLQMAATILIFSFIGYKLDHWLHLKFPAFTIGFVFLSAFGSFYYLIKQLTRKD